jgi:hypothetical protein
MNTVIPHPRTHASAADHQAVAARVAGLTGAQSQLVLQYLAGLSPADVDRAISVLEALQPGQDPR